MLSEQFDLIYHGHLSYSDVDDMPVYARKFLLKRLIEVKKEEEKAYEEATKTPKYSLPHG